jgi:pyrroline-5-carboxylate reductase
MASNPHKVAILGVGRIGESLLSGLLSAGWRNPGDVMVTARSADRLEEISRTYGVAATQSNVDAVAGAGLVVVAVKPQDIDGLLAEIAPQLGTHQTVLSVAAAIPTKLIERQLPEGVPVVRAMPNAPSTVHEGMAGICAGTHARDAHLDLAEEALAHLGAVVRVPEQYMDAVTAVSGSGPAYFALLAEAMIEAGILLGLGRETSTQLVVQTMLGTAKLLRDEGMHPVELREAVTSPGGTTIQAIRELENAGVRAAFLNAIQAAMVRSKELAEEAERNAPPR